MIKDVRKITQNTAKEQRVVFLGMSLGAFGASLLGNLLTGKEVIKAGEHTNWAGKWTIRAGQDFWCHLIL